MRPVIPAFFAHEAGVSQAAVAKAVAAGKLHRDLDGSLDLDNEVNAAWLAQHASGRDDKGRALGSHHGPGARTVKRQKGAAIDTRPARASLVSAPSLEDVARLSAHDGLADISDRELEALIRSDNDMTAVFAGFGEKLDEMRRELRSALEIFMRPIKDSGHGPPLGPTAPATTRDVGVEMLEILCRLKLKVDQVQQDLAAQHQAIDALLTVLTRMVERMLAPDDAAGA
jgi:hypothetical protein